jgi:peptide-methionine (S)-S-oxide reductase
MLTGGWRPAEQPFCTAVITLADHPKGTEYKAYVMHKDRADRDKHEKLGFQIYDPTTLNRQGNDRGTSYRSAIFYTNDEQKRIAKETIADVDASGIWPGKVVT